jgi:hypothetical protein
MKAFPYMIDSANHDDHALARAKVLGDGIRDMAGELRLIDVADLIAYIRTERFANIEDLVNSSAELFFKEGTVSFAWGGDLDVKWGLPPTIVLGMEFRHMSVTVFFDLSLKYINGGVEIYHICFDNPSDDPEVNTRRLAEAIADARLPSMQLGLSARSS